MPSEELNFFAWCLFAPSDYLKYQATKFTAADVLLFQIPMIKILTQHVKRIL